ncbi:MAG: PKD domain-containing protein [Bacteroidia bacterium]|nr:PKD domain-containing protein [Bacteroidia bacterium]
MIKRLSLLFLLGTQLFFTLSEAQVADFSASTVSGCSPLIVKFTDLSTGGGANPSWSWDLGNGNVSINQNPTATYNTPGTYTVKLTYKNNSTGLSDTETKTAYITVFANPTANFTTNDTVGCAPLLVNLTDLSVKGSGNIASWLWTFGDGTPPSSSQNPIHTYVASGNYTISLTVTDVNGCKNTFSKTAYIKVSTSNLAASFTSSPSVGCKAPATFNFTNTSTGTGTITYTWAFGDGQTSSSTSPSNTYAASGTYTVTLTASSSAGCAKTSTAAVSVLGGSNVTFSASDSSVCLGTTIGFTDKTNPVPSAWSWAFGDGGTSTSQNPSHTFATAGTYSVKLKVVFSGICNDSVTKTSFITVNPKPSVSFTADTTHTCSVPFTVKFTDKTTPAPATWKWYFGDGNTSTSQNPTHIYNSTGTDSVKLVVTTAAGCKDSLTIKNYINIIPPVAKFTPTPDKGCVPLTVNFTDQSTSNEPITSYAWDFGDPASGASNTSTLKNPSHIYNAIGNYTVKLTITNSYGCVSTFSFVAIQVTNKPTVNFTASPLNSCALTPVNFDGTTSVNGTTWVWSFGDGQSGSGATTTHLYSDTGLFNIQLIVFNIGCPDTLVKNQYVHISPAVPRFTSTLNCSNVLSRTFTNSSLGADKWYWNFGDGSPVDSTNYNPSHTYATAGTYTVKLTAKNNSSGCKKDTTIFITLIDLKPLFTLVPNKGCNPLPVKVTSQTSGGTPASYSWTFGDGGTSGNVTTANHTYSAPGLFTVKLFVTDNFGCTDSLVKTDSVKVYDITPDFYIKSQSGCDSLQVFFRDTSKTNPAATAWLWTFGDGKTSIAQHPSHYYSTPGSYNVTLLVTNSDGSCSVTKNNIVVFKKPSAAFTASSTLSCPGTALNFTNQSTNTNKYLWDFGDPASGINNTSTLSAPSHTYAGNGTYTVKLIATDSITGCSNTLTKTNYIIIDKPVIGFKTSSTASTCPPLSVTFVDTSTAVSGISNRYWDFGDGNIAPVITNDTASNTYLAAGKYTVKLIVTDSAGCVDSVIKVNLVVVNGPSGNYTFTPTGGCIPFTVSFTINTINTKTDSLDFGDGTPFYVGDTCCVTHTYTSVGTKTPFLTLIDSAGCKWLAPSPGSILISPYPASNFTYTPTYPKPQTNIPFTDLSVVGVSWKWDFGDGKGTSTLQNPVYNYSKPGIYYVKEVVDNLGCIDSITKEIIVIEDLRIPNVFSPNNDGKNDTFTLEAFGITHLDVHIYDRWGIEMYYKVAEKVFWDGHTNAGLEAPDGTYYYIINATSITGQNQIYKGFLQLLR